MIVMTPGVVSVLRVGARDEVKNGVRVAILGVVSVLRLSGGELESEVTGWTVEDTRKVVWSEVCDGFTAEGNEVQVGCM